MRFVIFVATLFVSFVATSAQTPVFRGRVDLVEVTVTVTDAGGRLVTGLTKDAFTIFEDGVPQYVSQFTDARVPVSLGVLLDISDSMVGKPMADARGALDRFVHELLEPADEVFVAAFNHGSKVIAPWTQPPSALKGALDAVRPNGSTAIYDALAGSTPLFAARRHVRTALVLISDGADTASDLPLSRARDVLLRSDPFVYAVAIDSSAHPRASSRVNPEALREITGPTGGYTEVVRSTGDLGPATERIAYELNHQYTLGYVSTHPPDGGWRTIRVRMRDRAHFARARRGYFATPPTPPDD